MTTARVPQLEATLERLRAAEQALQERTKRLREAKSALREQRERYAELFEFGPTGYLVTDRSGRIEEANRAVGELLGIAADSLIGKSLTDLVQRGARRGFRERLREALARRGTSRFEIELEPRSGVRITAEVAVARTGAGAGPGDLRWTLQDVS